MNEEMSYHCTLNADEAEQRAGTDRALLERVRDTQRLEHGLRVSFAAGPQTRRLVDAFVRNEARCCSFFAFSVEEQDGGVVLEISAPPDQQAQRLVDAARQSFEAGPGAVADKLEELGATR